MNHNTKSHIALFISGLMFAVNYWVAKELMPDPLMPRQIIFFRLLFAAILFWLVSIAFAKERVAPKHLIRIAVCSLFGVSINQVFFFEGLNLTTPVDAALLHAAAPIIVLLFASWLIREKIYWINIVGIICGAAGALLLVIPDSDTPLLSGSMLGNLFILVNMSSYALYLVIVKPVMALYHPLTVMKWLFLFGFIAVMPFSVHTMFDLSREVLNPHVLLSLAYVVLATTMLAYLFTIYALKHLKASSVGYYIYLQPLMAALIGALWFSEKIGGVKIISAIFIFGGVFLVNRRKSGISLKKDAEME